MSKKKVAKLQKPTPLALRARGTADLKSPMRTVASLTQQQAQIQEMIKILKENNLTELEVERDGLRIRVQHETEFSSVTMKVPHQTATASVSLKGAPMSKPSIGTTNLHTVVSPIVGTFYRSPSPDADPYVEDGDYVKKGQVLCIIEAMKLMNEIESEVEGRITSIIAESTKAVDYGQALFLIDPTATP